MQKKLITFTLQLANSIIEFFHPTPFVPDGLGQPNSLF